MNPDTLHLRPATNADAPAVRELVFSILIEFGLKPDPDRTDADLADIEAAYHRRGGCFGVVVDPTGRIVGSVGLYPHHLDARIVELRKMYLHPDVRGRGWGKRLFEDAVKQARKLGFARMVLETATVLRTAVALYQSYGCQPYQTCEKAARCDQTYYLDL